MEAKTPDGWSVRHNFMNEEAVYSTELETELRDALAEFRHVLQFEFPTLSFKSKTARLWIQNYIDECTDGEFGDLILDSQARHLYFGDSFSQFTSHVMTLRSMIDVLFHFQYETKVKLSLKPGIGRSSLFLSAGRQGLDCSYFDMYSLGWGLFATSSSAPSYS